MAEGYGKADPDNKVHGANMGPTWVLSAPDGPHVVPRTLLSWNQLQTDDRRLKGDTE